MTKDLLRIAEVSALTGLTVGTLYHYRAKQLYDLPEPSLTVGVVHFWKRKDIVAWARGRKPKS